MSKMLFPIFCPPCNATNLTRGARTQYSNYTNLSRNLSSILSSIKDYSVPVK